MEEHHCYEEAFRIYERGVSVFKFPHSREIWLQYINRFIQRYQGSKLERAREIFERVKNNVLKYTEVDKFLNEQLRKQKISYHKAYENLSVAKVIEIEGFEQAYRKLIFLYERELDCTALLRYLQNFLKENTPKCLNGNSELKRLIRIYDLLKYK